jgi:hypothetical protein
VTTGYSGTPLAKKLGIADGMHALLVGVPESLTEIGDHAAFASTETVVRKNCGRVFDYVHVFERDLARLAEMVPALRAGLKPAGMLWISWPKKASKVPTDIVEDRLRELLLPTGLVDVKVAAIDDIWSGLKFMFRKDVRASL